MKKLFMIIVLGFMAMIVVAEEGVDLVGQDNAAEDAVAGPEKTVTEDCDEQKIIADAQRQPDGKSPVGVLKPSAGAAVEGNK